ncbi:MAG: hypothetical protein HYU64_02530 [Armatimonadetes bacterium]|nr:hypothetical protein [Armatimonadota bacterium]
MKKSISFAILVSVLALCLSGLPAASPSQVSMNFFNADIDLVLQFMSHVSGLTIIKDPALTGKVTLMTRRKVTVEEALRLLDQSLQVRGYSALRKGEVLKIVPLDRALAESKLRRAGAPREGDPLMTQIIPMRNLDASQLKGSLQPLVSKQANISADATSNTLIVTDYASHLDGITALVRQMEKQAGTRSVIGKVIPLTYADAVQVASELSQIFGIPTVGRSPGGRQGRQAPGAGGQLRPGQSALVENKVVADARTNSVIITGVEETVARMEAMIKDLDVPTATSSMNVYKLQNAEAEQLQKQLSRMFAKKGLSHITVEAEPDTNSLIITASPRSLRDINNMIRSLDVSAPKVVVEVVKLLNTRSKDIVNVLSTFLASPALQGKIVVSSDERGGKGYMMGNVKIFPDQNTNTVILTGPRAAVKNVKEMIQKLDILTAQVLIEAIVVEVTSKDGTEFGPTLAYSNLGLTPAWVKPDVAPGMGLGFQAYIVKDNISALINILRQSNDVRVVSNATVITQEGKAGKVVLGQQIPYIATSRISETGSVVNSFSYKDVKMALTVTPHINESGYVSLDINQTIDTLMGTAASGAPVIASREAVSSIMVKDENTIVLAGIIKDEKSTDHRRVPILGDIPILGAFLGNRKDVKERTEIMIFLSPHVIRQAEEATEETQSQMRKLTEPPPLPSKTKPTVTEGGAETLSGRIVRIRPALNVLEIELPGGKIVEVEQDKVTLLRRGSPARVTDFTKGEEVVMVYTVTPEGNKILSTVLLP